MSGQRNNKPHPNYYRFNNFFRSSIDEKTTIERIYFSTYFVLERKLEKLIKKWPKAISNGSRPGKIHIFIQRFDKKNKKWVRDRWRLRTCIDNYNHCYVLMERISEEEHRQWRDQIEYQRQPSMKVSQPSRPNELIDKLAKSICASNIEFSRYVSRAFYSVLDDHGARGNFKLSHNKKLPTVFHFTKYGSLINILNGNSFRMTSPFRSTDISELKNGPDEIIKILSNINFLHALESSLKLKENVKDVEDASNLIYSFCHDIKDGEKLHEDVDSFGTPFMFCLSSRNDLITHWREYADSGRGIAIEFFNEHFEEIAQRYDQMMMFHRVAYHHDHKKMMLIKFLSDMFDAKYEYRIDDNEFKLVIRKAMALMAPFFKHPGYYPEYEWRLFTFVKNTDYSSRVHRLYDSNDCPKLSFLSFEVNYQSIKSIWIGPQVSEELIHDLKLLLNEKNIFNIKIYRDAPVPHINRSGSS